MREILFRGKRDYNNEWVYGSLIDFSFGKNTQMYIVEKISEYSLLSLSSSQIIDRLKRKVIPETVGQFTGLTDKNGKSSFEGDRITFPRYILGSKVEDVEAVVTFKNGSFGIEYEHDFWPLLQFTEPVEGSGHYVSNHGVVYDEYVSTFVVIGNIHDQKEQS